jgi:hypothetical protein
MEKTEEEIRNGIHYKCTNCDKLFDKDDADLKQYICDKCNCRISKFEWIWEELIVTKKFDKQTYCKDYIQEEVKLALEKLPDKASIRIRLDVEYKEKFHRRLIDSWY